jgi:hypothetical protein
MRQMPVQQTLANAQVQSSDCVAELRCGPSFLIFIHSEARHEVAEFDESRPAMQRVLKFPFRIRWLNASSQLNGIFSTRSSARGSCRSILPVGSAIGAGTALHLSWNKIPVTRFSLWIRFETSDVNVGNAGALNFARMSPAEAGQMQSATMVLPTA